ncbi:MAG: endonuclease III domain-containing protein [Halobacteriota archaeon]
MKCRELGWGRIVDIMWREAEAREAPVSKKKSGTPFKHLVSAVLSSRTRDEMTIQATERLFEVIEGPEDLKELSVDEIEKLIWGVGFYRVKAHKLKELADTLLKDYGSLVPSDYEELVKLPGVGRKTANVVLASAFNKSVIAVDTHVHRISNRMGFVETEKPEETEDELKEIVPKDYWVGLNRAFVGFGQTVCKPQRPLCSECPFDYCCPKIGVTK